MKKILIICMLAIATLSVQSCATRRTPINDLASLVNKVEKNGMDYTLTDWDKVIKQCARIESEMQKYDYTAKENEEIGSLKGRLAAIVTKDILTFSIKKTTSLKDQAAPALSSFLEELLK
jgi:hypothetical protein